MIFFCCLVGFSFMANSLHFYELSECEHTETHTHTYRRRAAVMVLCCYSKIYTNLEKQ